MENVMTQKTNLKNQKLVVMAILSITLLVGLLMTTSSSVAFAGTDCGTRRGYAPEVVTHRSGARHQKYKDQMEVWSWVEICHPNDTDEVGFKFELPENSTRAGNMGLYH